MCNSQRVVLITGGASGLGYFLANCFAQEGDCVFVLVRKKPVELDSRIIPLIGDVRDTLQLQDALRVLHDTYGISKLDVLINNAGVVVPGPLERMTDAELTEQFDVNVLSVVRVTRTFLPLLRSAKGKVINVGSMASRMAVPFVGLYGASKAALKQISWAMRLELRLSGVDVFHLEVGNFGTPIWTKSLEKAEKFKSDSIYGDSVKKAIQEMTQRSGKTNPNTKLWAVVKHICEGRTTQFNTLIGKDAALRKWLTLLMPYRKLENALAARFGLFWP